MNKKFSIKKINKKNLCITIAVLIIVIILIILFSLYIANENFRNFIDVNIFRKSINDNNTSTIEFEDDSSAKVFSYDKYIAILNKNVFTI